MKCKNIFLFLFIIFFKISVLNAQNITGTVKDNNGTVIENANITFWDSEKKETLFGYSYTDQKGNFSFKLNPEHTTVYIEATSLDYASFSKSINVKELTGNIDFILERKEIELKEVVINEEKKAVRIKNDTVFYDPKKFLNGTERKVEDLIKKLPGMTVNEQTGEIKYKGKSIETVKLEDDDLFGGNYSLGTKNISVDMVEQVQAIENYSSNPLLKGIENSDKVAINLKLKKQKTDYSGSGTLSNGYSNKVLFNDDVTLLGISKKIKSFGILAYNNFGMDANNLNSYNESYNPNQLSNEDLYAKKNNYESSANSILPSGRTKFNNTFFSNYNLIYKLSSRISIKNNLIYYYDKTEATEFYKTHYSLNNGETIDNTQENKYFRKPNYYGADLKLTYNVNKKSLLITDFSLKNQIVNSGISTLQNSTNQFDSTLKTNDFFIKAKTEYTLKIADKRALQFSSIFSKNNIPQESINKPSNNFITGNNSDSNTQNSTFGKEVFYNKLTYLESREKIKETFSLGYLTTNQPFHSRLTEDNVINTNFENDLVYKKSNIFTEYSSMFLIKKFKIEPSLILNFFHQNLENNFISTVEKRNDFIINPTILISYILNPLSSFYINCGLQNMPPSEEYFFKNPVLTSNTSIRNNIPSLDFVQTKNLTFGYKYYDLFKQFSYNSSLTYSNKQNTFLNNVTINPNFTTYTYFQSPTNIESKGINFSVEKQIMDWKLSAKHSSSFSYNIYKNAIDDFQLRSNKSKIYNGYVLFTTFFNFPINIEDGVNYTISSFESDNSFHSERTSITNKLKLVIKPAKDWHISLSNEYYITDTRSNSTFSFLDFDIKYQSSKLKWLSFNLIGKNLGNISTYTQVSNSDYSYSVYQSNLIPRYFLALININF